MNKIVNICFITDKKYAIPTGVAVQSLINNKNKDTLYNINIICTDLNQDQTKSFEKLNTYNVNVSVINTGNKYSDIGFEHVYVSKAAMLKFDLPNILPNIDKVLYLDGDMLIFDDLSSLYDIDLKNKYAAVVKDMAGTVSEGHHIKMKHKDYFNSGMMLLNLKKMRDEEIVSKLIYAKKHDKYKHFMDQDTLNQVFDENVVYVSPKYNYMKANLNYTSDEIAKFYKIKKSELEQISQNPTILHLTNIKKPWACDDAPCYDIWQKYYKKYLVKTKGRIILLSDFFSRYKRKFDANSTIKGNFIFTKEKLPNGRRHIYICGIKVASYMKKAHVHSVYIKTSDYKLNYKTYADLSNDIKNNIYKLPKEIDLVVGIPRSGMIPAYMVAFLLNTPVCSLDEFISGKWSKKHSHRVLKDGNIHNVLILDDSCSSGRAMKEVKEKLADKQDKYNMYFWVCYMLPGAEDKCDGFFVRVPNPRRFQWNYLNHPEIEKACFDIDGVLCYNPTQEENDDGEKYKKFILNARPLFIPKYKIKALVTSRLEKYRKETEEWLDKHGVKYEKLYMLDLPSKEERIKQNAHAKFKAKIFASLDSPVFYESDKKQAEEIFDLTGKPCFCVDTDELIQTSKKSV